MKLLDKISMAFSDLMNRKVRSILTIIAVSIGSLLLVAMMGLGDGIINKVKDMVSSFGDTNIVQVMPIDTSKMQEAAENNSSMQIKVIEEGSKENINASQKKEAEFTKKISEEDIENMKNMDGVEKVDAVINGKATGLNLESGQSIDRNITVLGVNLKYNHDYSENLVAGNSLVNGETDILVGENFTSKLGFNTNEGLLGKKIKVKVEYPKMNGVQVKEPKEIECTIVGVLNKKKYSDTVIMGDKKAEPLLAYFTDKETYINENGYNSVNIYAKEGMSVGDLSAKITRDFGYQTFSMEMINSMLNVLGTVVKGVLSIAGIIVLVVAALGLVNTISMTLQEKKKMIGVMRSIGGSRSNIRTIFIFQSIILGLGGGLLGGILSSGGILFANEYITKKSNFVISLTGSNVAISIGITLLISVIAGLIPASRAARLNVVEAVAEE
ncbi:ABC transporter permease [Clostridium sp. SHJSY1]|uniref:ABC transporter permease n=1 Tax=Clostridium sp. SHJSY1 TaxID=2942483 RepID=UPI002875D13C|nr:ABC transporter permease [Clostridium sp. SHJSY1]MDS0528217.1 ABC transporter permease [Clostridium sp. SHJSY1]